MKFVNYLEEWVMALLLGFMTVITFIQVILRYVFNTGWTWSLEATLYSFAWLVIIGMSYGVRTHAHIAVDLATNKLPAKIKKFVALLAIGICIIYCGLMVYGSSAFVQGLYTLSNNARDIPLPKWLLTSIMPVGFCFLIFRFLEAGWHVLKGDVEDTIEAEAVMMDGSDKDGDKQA